MTEDRHSMTAEQRLGLLERDVRDHSKTLTEIIQSVSGGFNQEQLVQLRAVFRDELADAGLRIDEPEHVDDAREDFRFLRRLRVNYDNAAKKVGNSIIMAIIGVVGVIVALGFWSWIGKGP
jgi:hypothetical protein